jgi:tRNA (uracil-5-)-methyltransferase TRM9
MDSATAARLLKINRDFYDQFGDSFSVTRQRIQPGVRRVLELLNGDEAILDLGCGNGELARVLARRNHRGSYLGLDFSLPLLKNAESQPQAFPVKFLQADLTSDWDHVIAFPSLQGVLCATKQSPHELEIASSHPMDAPRTASPLGNDGFFDLVFCFAALHHIPSFELRLNIIQKVRALLKPEGRFILSNWQFLNSDKLKARIQPWEAAAISSSEVDAGDYLLDWRSGGTGLRYAHHFTEGELSQLAQASGFRLVQSFYSDGNNNKLGLYQIWG